MGEHWMAGTGRSGHVKREEPGLSRNTKVLWTLIAMAAAALVVSAAILMMLKDSGDFSTKPRITKVTSASESAARPSGPNTAAETGVTSAQSSESSTSETSESSGSESPAPSSAERIAPAPQAPQPSRSPSFHPTPGVG